MALFENPDQLKSTLQTLFDRVAMDPSAVKGVSDAKLILRLNITNPPALVVINGRKSPPQILYGSSVLKPDLDITLSAETLHRILLRKTRLREAVTTGQLNVRGPVWKSFVLEDIFHSAQALYPQVLDEFGYQ